MTLLIVLIHLSKINTIKLLDTTLVPGASPTVLVLEKSGAGPGVEQPWGFFDPGTFGAKATGLANPCGPVGPAASPKGEASPIAGCAQRAAQPETATAFAATIALVVFNPPWP